MNFGKKFLQAPALEGKLGESKGCVLFSFRTVPGIG